MVLKLELRVVSISVLLNEIFDLFTKDHQIINCIQTKNSVYGNCCNHSRDYKNNKKTVTMQHLLYFVTIALNNENFFTVHLMIKR